LAELLARSGVGELVLIDGDSFSDNNLNRQVLCGEADLGRLKAEVAAERVRAVNGATEVLPFAGTLDENNADERLAGCDLAVDALDNQRARRILRGACGRAGIPLVHGAIAGFYGQVGVVAPGGPALWDALGEEAPDRGIETETGNPAFTPALIAAWEAAEAVKLLTGAGTPLTGRVLWVDLAEGSVQSVRL
jgi:molybdopterin/thiamine biosynthesis adenylyltransferase